MATIHEGPQWEGRNVAAWRLADLGLGLGVDRSVEAHYRGKWLER